MVRPMFTLLAVALALAAGLGEDARAPRGLPELKTAPDSPHLVELGRRLFSEKRLSADGAISCASCHDPQKNFATADARAIGIGKQLHRRNAPALINRAFGSAMFWDGRSRSLEDQALLPITDPGEMGNTLEKALAALATDYPERFQLAFGTPEMTAPRLAQALAAFQRTLLVGNSPVDAFIDTGHLADDAKHGLWLFESRGGCWKCHSGKNYSDEGFHNTGVGWGREPLDLGRYEVTKTQADRGKFKTPTLRGLVKTAPYMHDGSIRTLEEVIDFYDQGGHPNPHLDPAIKPLQLTATEKANLVAFLQALSEVVKEP